MYADASDDCNDLTFNFGKKLNPIIGCIMNMKYYSILTYLLKDISNDNIKFTSGNAASGTTLTTRSWSIKVLEFPTLVVQT